MTAPATCLLAKAKAAKATSANPTFLHGQEMPEWAAQLSDLERRLKSIADPPLRQEVQHRHRGDSPGLARSNAVTAVALLIALAFAFVAVFYALQASRHAQSAQRRPHAPRRNSGIPQLAQARALRWSDKGVAGLKGLRPSAMRSGFAHLPSCAMRPSLRWLDGPRNRASSGNRCRTTLRWWAVRLVGVLRLG